jgi:hypothetical protein
MSELTTVEREPTAAAPALSPVEIGKALESLTDGQKTALSKIARVYARKTPYGYEDLINEAICRVLDGKRAWRRGLPVILFLGGVMRSIAWEWKKDLHEEEIDVGDEGAGERGVVSKIDVMRIVALFNDDPIAQRLVMGMMEGARGEELLETSGLSQTEYESKRKKIRRRIEKLSL